MLRSKFNGRDIYLIETVEELQKLRQAVEKCATIGLDTETEGLDFNKDRVVGVCISFSDKRGFYVPYRHVDYENNLPKEEVIEMCQYILDNKIVMFFNRNYDLNMLEFDGVKIPYNGRFHDVQVMCWEATNEPFPSLKKYTKMYLKWDMIEFETAAGTDEDGNSNHNFGLVDPREGYRYAAGDPLATVALGKYMWNNYPYIRKIYPLDNLATEAVRRMGQEVVSIDYNLLKQLADESERELRDLRYQIIKFVGYEFNIGSNREKGRALSRFVTLTVKTKNGDFSMRDEIISEIDHPLAQLMVKYSKAFKFNNSFIKPLLKLEGTPIRFNFKTVDVPCLTEESTVFIENKGVVSVKDVRVGDNILTRSGFKQVTFVKKSFSSLIIRVRFKNTDHSFSSTPWHPVLVSCLGGLYAKWKKVSELQSGDKVVVNTFECNYMSKHWFYEGVLSNSFLYKKGGDDFIVSVFADLSKNLSTTHAAIECLCDDCQPEVESLTKSVKRYDFHSYSLYKRAKLAQDKVPTISVMGSIRSYLLGACLYFQEEDGDIRIPILNSSVCYSERLTKLLSYFGVYVDERSRNFFIVDKASKECFYRLINSFFDSLSSKSTTLTVRYLYTGIPSDVYHIEVEDVHEYISDGIVHHNTGRMACLSGDTKVRVIRSWSASHEEDINLKEIYAGDRIKTRFGYYPVVGVYKQRKELFKLRTFFTSIKATSDHLFYQGNGVWKEVSHLNVGDYLVWSDISGKEIRHTITEKESVGEDEVFDIQVDSVHEFLVNGEGNPDVIKRDLGYGGYVTHNCGKVNGNSWFAPLNVQALPKKKVHRFLHEGGDMGYYLDDNPEGAVHDENGKPIDQEVKAGFRDIFTVPSDEWAFISSDYCLSNQSMVKVKGFGEIPLYFVERLIKFYKMQVYIETPNGWEKVIRFVNTEKKPKVQITLKSGEMITCSEDHSFKVRTSKGNEVWRPVKELKPDDVILTKDLNLSR